MYKKKRKKYFGSSHIDVKREIACFHVEPAKAKMAGKLWSGGHFCRSRYTYTRC